MKRSIVTLSLLAFVIMLTTSYAITPEVKPEPASCIINYYWFDITRTWMGRRNTVCDEILLTAYSESTQNPKTIQELGWAPGNVSVSGNGMPTPNSSFPDKILYSHP